jgi:hypothetical protein
MWRSFMENGRLDGEIVLLRPDGRRIPVRFRARANHPEPGLHASVLERPDESPDGRPVEEIVAAAFATPTPAGGRPASGVAGRVSEHAQAARGR